MWWEMVNLANRRPQPNGLGASPMLQQTFHVGLELEVDGRMQDLGIGMRGLIPPRANHYRGRRHGRVG